MRFKAFQLITLVATMMISTSFTHPLKLTSSLVEYDEEQQSISIQCRVFIDDFENTIDRIGNILNNFENSRKRNGLDATNISEDDEAKIEFYFQKCYRFKLNGEELELNYESSEAKKANNTLNLIFNIEEVSMQEGDELLIENTLFFEEFGQKQVNRMTLRLPPFIMEQNQVCTLESYFVSYNF